MVSRPTPSPGPARTLCRQGAIQLFGMLLSLSAQADIFVSSEKDHQILQMDDDGKVIRLIKTCDRPRHMAWANGNQHIMVACGDSNQIGIIDLLAGKLTDALPTGESPEIFALSPDGKSAYVSIEEGSQLTAYDVASKSLFFHQNRRRT